MQLFFFLKSLATREHNCNCFGTLLQTLTAPSLAPSLKFYDYQCHEKGGKVSNLLENGDDDNKNENDDYDINQDNDDDKYDDDNDDDDNDDKKEILN